MALPVLSDWSPLRISLETSFVATLITLVVGVMAAAWRDRHTGPAMAFLDGVFLLPLVLPPTVVGFFLLLLFGRQGPIGKLLLRLGTTVVFSWPATVIAAAVVSFPLMYLTARAALQSRASLSRSGTDTRGHGVACLPRGCIAARLAGHLGGDDPVFCQGPGRIRCHADGRRQYSRKDSHNSDRYLLCR